MPDYVPYTAEQLNAALLRIRDAMYTSVGSLEITAWRTREPVPFSARFAGEELQLRAGDKWGELFDSAWFRFRGEIPRAAAGQPVVALLDVNGEMCVVDPSGVPARGLTHVSLEFDKPFGGMGKRVLALSRAAEGREPIEIWADAGCNDLFGNLRNNGTVRQAEVAVCHPEIRALYYDFEVLLDSVKALPESSARRQQILVALHDVAHMLGPAGPSPELVGGMRERLAPELGKRGGDPSLCISAIGHAHIDLAWLWPLRETKRKGARTFATAVALMDEYPDYLFAASQAQLFQWMKELYPGLYSKIKARVKEGRLEPQGALWVETDTNLVGGESWIRQILYGRRFFREEFGVDVDYVWLPDTFGFSAAVPQILASAGIRCFATQKLSWSLVNQFPHHSFEWQGIDGSCVLVHMLPEEEYSSRAAPQSLAKIEANYRDKGVSDQALLAFGIGDGGGGPGEEHLERLARLANFAGLSPVQQRWTADFFRQWSKDAGRFATWVGEMYLERHQGTLTTHGRNKWYNRRMEQALREWEWLALLASLLAGEAYPIERMREIWQEVLLYQFHDILPGSSIKRVYDETAERYGALLPEVEQRIRHCQEALAARVDTTTAERPALVFNSLSWERTDWLKLGGSWRRVTVPPMGYVVLDLARDEEAGGELSASADLLENDRLRVGFDESGAITSVFDKAARREVIPAGEKGNRLAVYRDTGDAWDFPMDYAATPPRYMRLTSAEAWIDGPRAVLLQEYRLGHSILAQEISLAAGSPVLEFATRATWRETASMLRTAFPVALHATEATSETQFGYIRRATHRNTTWDLARDETAAHRWVDLSQRDYGVALLNDSKYGHKIKGNVLDINLVRSVPYPGPRLVAGEDLLPGEPHAGYTDQTDHYFRYALYPHQGDHVLAQVARAAAAFNIPLRMLDTDTHAGLEPARRAFVELDCPSVVIETAKKAEDGSGWVMRLYEADGGEARVVIRLSLQAARVEEANSMEEPFRQLDLRDGAFSLVFRPFEIKTLLVSR